MTSSCIYYVPKCGLTRLCDQNCGVQPAEGQTHRQTHTQTHGHMDSKSLKTEGPMILSIDIFYFRTVIIGGPIKKKCANGIIII